MDEFASHTGIKWNGHVGMAQYGNDSSMVVMFYVRDVLNPARSKEEGRPYYDDIVYVRIHPPGERLNIIDRAATDNDKKRWPMQWAQFAENRPQESNGTPVDLLFPASPATAGALKASGVHTVEQLADLSAHAIETIGMGAQQWCNDAKRYLQVAQKGVKASELKAVVEEKDREIHTLNHKIDILEKELNVLRDRASHAVTADEVMNILAQNGGKGNRAIMPTGNRLTQAFDAQAAQIAGVHPSNQGPKRRRAKLA
jgi:hypothetical protein